MFCNKRKYPTKGVALKELKKIKKKKKKKHNYIRKEKSIYFCDKCNAYHLSSYK